MVGSFVTFRFFVCYSGEISRNNRLEEKIFVVMTKLGHKDQFDVLIMIPKFVK